MQISKIASVEDDQPQQLHAGLDRTSQMDRQDGFDG